MSDTSLTILLIDDNPDDRLLIKRTLLKDLRNIRFLEPKDPMGFQQILKKPFDLVITDYQLKWSNGLKILEEVKRVSSQCPVLMFTATGNEEIAVSAMKSGLDDYILKSPKYFMRLSASVKSLLEKAENVKKLRETETALAIARHEWEAVFQAIPQPAIVLKNDFTILAANRANEPLTRMAAEELVGKKCFALYHQLESPPETCPLRELLRTRNLDGPLQRELEVMGRNVLVAVMPINNSHGGMPKKYIHIATDVTELRRAEREKEILQDQVYHAQKMEAIGTLVSGVAHDFNNILGSILGFTELAIMKSSDTSPILSYLKEILSSSHRAADLVNQLLLFCRKNPSKTENFDPAKSLISLTSMFDRLLGEKITLQTNINKTWPIFGDKSSFEQVVANLVVNARDAMPQGGTLTIELNNITITDEKCWHNPKAYPGPFVQLVVSDTGTGIDKKVLPHIFEPFYTTKEIGKGTGLGLSVVHGVINQHNGWVDVDSVIGKGTTFTLYFPASMEREIKKEISPSPVFQTLKGDNEPLLVVEDDPMLRRFLTAVLSEHQYHIKSAQGMEEAFEICNDPAFSPALVFTDIVLPDGDGFQLAGILRKKHKKTRFLFTSGYPEPHYNWQDFQKRGMHFIMKPYGIQELLKMIKAILKT